MPLRKYAARTNTQARVSSVVSTVTIANYRPTVEDYNRLPRNEIGPDSSNIPLGTEQDNLGRILTIPMNPVSQQFLMNTFFLQGALYPGTNAGGDVRNEYQLANVIVILFHRRSGIENPPIGGWLLNRVSPIISPINDVIISRVGICERGNNYLNVWNFDSKVKTNRTVNQNDNLEVVVVYRNGTSRVDSIQGQVSVTTWYST